jgi:hypothetical protein
MEDALWRKSGNTWVFQYERETPMTDQIRSADLLVKNALASPKIMQELKDNPEQTLKTLGKDTVEMLPRALDNPNPLTTNAVVAFLAGLLAPSPLKKL